MPKISKYLILYFLRLVSICLASGSFLSSYAQAQGIRLTDEQALSYIASYPDLMASFGTDVNGARAHYENSGSREGRSITFNGLQYIASYPDLITVFGLDTETALRQYIRQGRSQGRVPSFDGLEYIASNMSLIGYLGTDTTAAAKHYITTGYRGGLKTASFDPLKYIASYADLIVSFSKNVVSGITHYITRGFSEGRTSTFNSSQYIANYSDIKAVYGNNPTAATTHYITSGFAEGRNDKKPNTAPTVTASTSPAATTDALVYPVNSTVSLLANGIDADGDRLTYSWTIQSKPSDSTATLGSPTNSSSGLSPDKPGTYTVDVTVSDGQSTAKTSLVIVAGTPVSGVLSNSTVWDKSLSPYIQTGRLAVPAGISLTIPAGVQLIGNGYALQVQGSLAATGTSSERVRLSKILLQTVSTTGQTAEIPDLKIVYADIDGVFSPTSSSSTNFVIEDSRIDVSNRVYLSSITKDSSLQRNYFVSSGIQFSYASLSKNLKIKNNSFPLSNFLYDAGGVSVTSYSSYFPSTGTLDFSLNTFRAAIPAFNSTPTAMRSTGAGQFDAKNNYWGVTEVSAVDRLIIDSSDDYNNGVLVNYTPFLTSPDALTPTR